MCTVFQVITNSKHHSSRGKRSGRSSAKKQLYPDSHNTTRSVKSSASSSVSDRRKETCIRDTFDKSCESRNNQLRCSDF